MARKKKTVEDGLAEADVLLPLDTLKEIEGFFPLGKPTIDTTYGMLSLKVNEINESEKEIIYEGSKTNLSRTVNIHGEYSKEEVIFYTYVLLHAKYDSWNPFTSVKSEKADKSNLGDFCHDFFTKAKDYTYKGDRDEFSTKRIFEMFLYCSVQTKEEYDLPPFEEYWRVFEAKDVLLPTTYELLFKHEKNSIRKEAVAQKAFAAQKEFIYLRYLLEQLFSRKEYKHFIDLYLSNTDVVTGHGTFPYEAELYFAFVESCIALKDFETLQKNLVDRDAMHLGGRYSKSFFEGIAKYFDGKYADAEVHFKKAILSDDEGRDVTRCATIFYIATLLKQKKNDAAKGYIFDLKPREPYAENYDLDYFGYKEIEKELLAELQKLDVSEEQKNALKFYEASILYEGSWHHHDKETTSSLVKKLKEVRGYNNDYTYHHLLSEGYAKLGVHDKAYKALLKSFAFQEGDIDVGYSASIEKTSPDFQEGLLSYLEKDVLIYGSKAWSSLARNELRSIADYWWKNKKYALLTELCNLIVEYDASFNDFEDYLFEFAYSFKEIGEAEDAKHYYELYIQKKGENSSVLNNLAIIYEQLGNLKKAKELIKKAHELTDGNDGVVNRNKKRLVDDEKSKGTATVPEKKTTENAKPATDFIEYDPAYGKLIYRGKEKMVRSSPMMPIMLKELFGNPANTKNAVDLLEILNRDTTSSNRSILDCIRQINKKIKELGVKEDPFTYRSDKVLTKETYVSLLRMKVSEVEPK